MAKRARGEDMGGDPPEDPPTDEAKIGEGEATVELDQATEAEAAQLAAPGQQIGGVSTPDHPGVVRETVEKDPAVKALELKHGMGA